MNARVTDNDFLASVLADGQWHGQMDIVQRSQRERGCGLTVHSRVSDLRVKRGLTIEQRSQRTGSGRVASFYRLATLEAPVEKESGPHPVSPLAGASSVGDHAPSYAARGLRGRSTAGETVETPALTLFTEPRGVAWEPGQAA